jgi:copper transport protein
MTPRRTVFNRVVLLTLFATTLLSFFSSDRALAHNEFEASNPADGQVVNAVPTEWEITFSKDVPLNSASAEVVNSDGVRTALSNPTHGAQTNVVRFALPPELSGPVTARWRLVSDDGHVVQGRVNFVVSSQDVVSETPSAEIPPSDLAPSDGVITQVNSNSLNSSFTDPAPGPVRWVVRSMGFAAVMLIGGLFFVERLVAAGTMLSVRGVLTARTGAVALAVVPFLQNLFLVGDVYNTNVFSALPKFLSTFDGTLGAMLITQTVIGLVITYFVYRFDSIDTVRMQFLTAMFAMYLIALAFNGHSRTMAWPLLGIPADIIHTAAAAVWLGGLAVLAFVVIPQVPMATAISAYRQFGSFAQTAVIALVATGIVQTLRLHTSLISLFTETHGRILLLKIVVVVAMLKIADINRKRLLRRLDPDAPSTEQRITLLWRASITEAATGGIILAITAALVTASFQ